MPDPSPAPNRVPALTFPVEPPPDGFAQLIFEKKMDWLNTHGLESDQTINLGDCYRCGTKLTQMFGLVFKFVKRLNEIVKDKDSASIKRYLNVFVNALNMGIGHLSNNIYGNITALINTGKFNDEAAAPTLVPLPELPTISDEDAVTPTTAGRSFDMVGMNSSARFIKLLITDSQSFWGVFVDTLNILIETWPWINRVGCVIRPAPEGCHQHRPDLLH